MLQTDRQSNMDALRVIAAVAVVFIHAASGALAVPFAAFNAVTRFGVPVFFMISGYFMPGKDYTAKDILKKTAKLFLIMLLWSCVYSAVDIISGVSSWGGVHALIKTVLEGPVHFWYFYAAMILYLFTPLLAPFCKNAEKGIYEYILALFFIFGCIVYMLSASGISPTLDILLGKAKFSAQTGFLLCFCLGYYFRRFGVRGKILTVVYILGALGAVSTFFAAQGTIRELAISFFSPAVMLTAVAVFAAFTQSGREFKLSHLAGYTRGVFIIHVLVLRYVNAFLSPLLGAKGFAYVALTGTVTTALSFLITFILKKIPLVKKVI